MSKHVAINKTDTYSVVSDSLSFLPSFLRTKALDKTCTHSCALGTIFRKTRGLGNNLTAWSTPSQWLLLWCYETKYHM